MNWNAWFSWIAPEALRALGLSLAHFIWQGAAIAALAAAAMSLPRSASARYAIGVGALALMLVVPVVTFQMTYSSAPSPGAVSASLTSAAPMAGAHLSLTAVADRHVVAHDDAASSESVISANVLNALVVAWFAGVILFSLRTAGGFFLIARLRRRDSHQITEELFEFCKEIQQRLGMARAIRYCESLHLDAPAVIGWFRPVVFLPVSALTGLTETQLRAVIAHELAHVRRFDAFVNVFQVAVETLLFYHPAVWWLNKRIRSERENCCDDVALSVCGNPADYARALALMEEWRVAPSFAMAANRGPLASRVGRLLGLHQKSSGLRNAGIAFATLSIAAALIAGNALFGIVHPVAADPKPIPQVASAEPAAEHVITITAPRPVPASEAQSDHKAAPAPKADQAPAPKSSYIEGMKAEGFDNLSADELIGMKVQGITPEYIHQIRAEGLNPSADELIGMKVQGITPEYIRQIRSMKLKSDVDSLIGMKVQGITPEYVDQMHKLGFQPNTDELMGMKVQGITSEYVDQMRKLGFNPDPDQLIGMKVQGITPDYVKQMNDLGLHPDADDVIGMKVQGINADYIRSIRALGLNPDKDEWIGMKVQGINADYVKAIQAAGFKPSVDELISAKVMGVTPEFIQKTQGLGFKNLNLEKIIQLKQAGVLE